MEASVVTYITDIEVVHETTGANQALNVGRAQNSQWRDAPTRMLADLQSIPMSKSSAGQVTREAHTFTSRRAASMLQIPSTFGRGVRGQFRNVFTGWLQCTRQD